MISNKNFIFDSLTSLTTSSDSYVFGGSVSGDVFLCEGATGNTPTKAASAALAEEKGYNGSNALAISATTNTNQGIYIFATEQNGNTAVFPSTGYLRVWVDFTDMDFRKATFGIVTKSGDLYSVGENNLLKRDCQDSPFFALWSPPQGFIRYDTLQGCRLNERSVHPQHIEKMPIQLAIQYLFQNAVAGIVV